MHILPTSSSLDVYDAEATFTEAALLADDDTQDLARAYGAFEDEVDTHRAAEVKLLRGEARAQARLAVARAILDGLVGGFQSELLHLVNQDRTATEFKRFFPQPASDIVKLGHRAECEKVENLEAECAKKGTAPSLKVFAPKLKSARVDLLARVEERRKAAEASFSYGHDVLEWKEGVNAARQGTFAELLKRSLKLKKGRGWAESFFRPAGRAAHGTAGEPAPHEAPAPAPTTA